MTWSIANSKNDESSKCRWELVPYLRGRVLDIGCGPYKVFPSAIGVDNGHHWGTGGSDIVSDAGDLSIFADESCDTVYSSHLLEHVPYENVPKVLAEWFRVLKKGGHLVMYLPSDKHYPLVGHPNANPDHRWNVSFEKLMNAIERVEVDWDLTDFQERFDNDEYSLWFVFKKI